MERRSIPPAPAEPKIAVQPSAPPPAPSSPTDPPTALGVSVEDQRRISDLYADLNRMDFYRLLGVSATSDVATIKRAYFALAKEQHPDRWFRKEVGALRPKIDAIFTTMTKALETLTDPEARLEYDVYLRELLKTRIHRRQAATLEAAGDFQAAAENAATIVERLPTDAYVHNRYAYAMLRAGMDYPRGIEAATRAIEIDPTRAEYRVTAASLYLAEARDRNAVAQLGVACELEPERRDLAALHAALDARVSKAR